MRIARLENTGKIAVIGRCTLKAFDRGALEFYGFDPAHFEQRAFERARQLARLNGHLRDFDVAENMVVDVGLQMIGDWAIDAEATGLTYFAIGTDGTTPVAGDTALNNEVARKALNVRSRSAQTVSLSTFFLAAESTYYIREEGVWGGAAASATLGSGTLFSHYLRPYDNSGGNFDLTFDYDVLLQRG